jgi:Fe2+ or Zn2+ uptake regulation protein
VVSRSFRTRSALDATALHLCYTRTVRFSTRAEAALRREGGRITRARRALLELIERSGRPLGPRELQAGLASQGVPMDRVSVYRNVTALLGLGLLHRVVGSTKVRPCSERERRCHHAIVCTECGSAREFHSGALERALGGVRRATRYRVQGHVLELRGVCERCQR